METLPSIQFPEPIPSCGVCRKGEEGGPSFVLQDLIDSTKAGCSVCYLRFLAIYREIPDPTLDVSVEMYLKFEGPLIRIEQVEETAEGPRCYDETEVWLYTKIPSKPKLSTHFIGKGRDVGHRSSSHRPVIIEWLKECHETHHDCPPNLDVALPTRVLDVGTRSTDLVRLVEVASGQRGRYTALSHCWGGGIEVRTTKGNYAAQKNGLRYNDLPLSFQHATDVTRGLGLRYLWIDALCIIQDSQVDWEIESGNMAAIYQSAYLVIGADMSPNSFGGFLQVQSGGYNGDGLPIATVDNTVIYARSEHPRNNDNRGAHPLFREPLSARAWTLQEQVLSSKMVHFDSKEMVWECKSRLYCECMQVDRTGYILNSPLALRSRMTYPFPTRYMTWYQVVNEVVKRSLTKPQDLLPCLSGIAQYFQDDGAGAYLAGLWHEHLPFCLLWDSPGPHKRSRAIPYRGPSWSWTSIDQVEYPYGWFSPSSELGSLFKRVYIKIIEAKCIPAGKDPLGAVSGGWLKVSAPLLKPGKERGIIYYHDSDKFRNENAFCLVIGELIEYPYPIRGLILRVQCLSTSTFERIGCFHAESERLRPLMEGIEDSIVTIL